VTSFRRSAHARLVDDLSRGRLLMQLAYLAGAEQGAIYDPYAWPPVPFSSLPPERQADVEHLRALDTRLCQEARRLGVTGGKDDAFREVFDRCEAGAPETMRTGWNAKHGQSARIDTASTIDC
jgi:hypothetical protein